MSSLPSSDKAFFKWLSSRLDPFQELSPNDEFYVPLYEGSDDDPVRLIANDICRASDPTLNFISGFSGSGKSTALRRLSDTLSAEGFFVVIADASDYFLPTQPIDIGLLLVALAGAYSDQIKEATKHDPSYKNYWQRLIQWLTTTEAKFEELELGGKVPVIDLELKLKANLKENPGFVEKLKAFMATKPGELRRQMKEYFEETARVISQKYQADLNPVFIFDQFEQLHDTPQSQGAVSESIITIVSNHQNDLRIPGHHVVMTMPPWLKLVPGDMRNMALIYAVKLWENDDNRKTCRKGLDQMRSVVEKRFTPDGLDRFFGPANRKGVRPHVDQLIMASAGHLRHLIILLREVLKRASELPVPRKIIDGAIDNHRDSFLPLSLAHSQYLLQFERERQCSFPNTKPETIYDVTTLFNNHYAFLMRNSALWCDVHPLLREIIAKNIARAATITAAAEANPAN